VVWEQEKPGWELPPLLAECLEDWGIDIIMVRRRQIGQTFLGDRSMLFSTFMSLVGCKNLLLNQRGVSNGRNHKKRPG
jgi:hypothetical protein